MKLRSLLLTAITGGTLALYTVPAHANLAGEENNFYSTILIQIKNAVVDMQGDLDAIAKMLFQAPQDAGQYITAWGDMSQLTQQQSLLTKQSTDQIDATFNGQDTLAQTVEQAFNIDTKGAGEYSGLSAYSLLGLTHTFFQNTNYYTTTYNNNQAKAAGDFIQFLSGAAMPIQPPSGDSLQDKQQLNLLRTMQAVQSLDAYNLSKAYTSRLPIANISSLNLTGIGNPDGMISKEGLLQYLMQSRVNNPSWYTQMSTASPFTAVKEGVFLMAAAVSELYQIEQDQQQLILTQTATNTATLAMAKTMLMQMQQASQLANQAKQAQ